MEDKMFPSKKKKLKETDFDGHTGFDSMTFEEKLIWLSEAAESIYTIKKNNKQRLSDSKNFT